MDAPLVQFWVPKYIYIWALEDFMINDFSCDKKLFL